MYVIIGTRKGDFKTPGLVTPNVMSQTDTIDSYVNEECIRICLTKPKNVFNKVIDIVLSPQEALNLADKLTRGAKRINDKAHPCTEFTQFN